MAAQLGMHQKDVHMFKPGAKIRLEDFKQSRKRYVKSVADVRFLQVVFLNLTPTKHTVVCNAWIDGDRKRHLLTITELRSQNKEL
jgi:hypothetical protein